MDDAIVEHGQLQESYLRRNNSEKHRFANYTSSKTTLSSSVATTKQQHRSLTSSLHNSSRTMRLTKAGSWLWLVLLSVSVYVVGAEDNRPWVRPAPVGATPTPAPELNFSAQPANTSVVEGSIAIMKCKAVRPVHHCSWYYIETNRSFYDEGAEPKLVKQFTPSKDNDCSIRFTKVRKVQEGQWLCQTRRYMGTTLYNTRPAYLQVITDTDERDYEERSGGSGDSLTPMSSGDDDAITTRDPTAPTAIPALGPPPSSGPLPFPPHGPLNPKVPPALPGPDPTQELPPSEDSDDDAKHEPEVKHAPRFNYSADDHILNTRTGATATLPCHVNVHVTSCAWVMPNSALFVWNEGMVMPNSALFVWNEGRVMPNSALFVWNEGMVMPNSALFVWNEGRVMPNSALFVWNEGRVMPNSALFVWNEGLDIIMLGLPEGISDITP
ncbi:uncharacterized protein LOC108680557 [Hyalella azteca]|uniref:Uncharacterized protein LOC108680557 n=1 Tax=Hyalella azteca TaxID=294128 RepID=A0A8B7PH91_HYAAZ|nr:uncharacterized protein LOC108680557 [Hyalella azteca]